MNTKRTVITLAVAALLFLSACHLARGTPEPAVSGNNETDQQTLIAFSVQQTQTAVALLIPPVPTETPSHTLSPTSQIPTVTVSVATNCRSGPGEPYDILGVLSPGETAEVVGRNASSDTWIIKLPSNPAIVCWLWGYYATVTGNSSTLPVYDTPPTPTPVADFSIAYVNMFHCIGFHGFRFQLTNNGSVTWESFNLVVTDNTTATTRSFTDDEFVEPSLTCTPMTTLLDLAPGEFGIAANLGTGSFAYNPVGHSISATFHLCSGNGLAGQCIDKTISFTP